MKTNTRTIMKEAIVKEYELNENEVQISRKAAAFIDSMTKHFIQQITIEAYSNLPNNGKRITETRLKKLCNDAHFLKWFYNRLDFSELIGNSRKPYIYDKHLKEKVSL